MPRHAIALDAGGTKVLAGIVAEDGSIGARALRNWPEPRTRDTVLACLEEAIADVRAAAAAAPVAVGVGLPANMDVASGVVAGSRHLPLAGLAFRDWLAEATGLPALVDNETTLALLAEHRLGAARGVDEAVMLTLGTGIGGGLLCNGRLVRGARGAAGEPGHMTIEADGPPCPGDCPGRGCLEAYVSGPALARAVAGATTGDQALEAARAGDSSALAALEAMAEKLGAGMASLLNLLDPALVIVGGGFGAAAGPLLVDRAAAVARERALEPAASQARIELARLGDDAGLIGAGLFALEEGRH